MSCFFSLFEPKTYGLNAMLYGITVLTQGRLGSRNGDKEAGWLQAD